MVINTLTPYFRFPLAMAQMVKDRAANCSIAPGRAKPSLPSADVSWRRLEASDITLTAVAEMAVNPGDWYGEIWIARGRTHDTHRIFSKTASMDFL
jgi:hypothetical protein